MPIAVRLSSFTKIRVADMVITILVDVLEAVPAVVMLAVPVAVMVVVVPVAVVQEENTSLLQVVIAT